MRDAAVTRRPTITAGAGDAERYIKSEKIRSKAERAPDVFSAQKKSKDRPTVRLCKRADDSSVMISRENWRVRLDLIRQFFI